ncbi:MAG: hypothetical protein QM786_13495 [Breznakibacter sp.]
MQTNVLKTVCGQFFMVCEDPFVVKEQYRATVDYNLAEQFLTVYPDSLSIDFGGLKRQSHGILAELAVKTTLWELSHHLKKAIDEGQFGRDTLFAQLARPVYKKLPTKKHDGKKAVAIMATVMHPSLPSAIKCERLTQLKLAPHEQKKLLETWTSTIVQWIGVRSRTYFEMLADTASYYQVKMLAAGDGSGTAGLLYEYEPHMFDQNRKGYGVGIGLFTYSYAIRREALVPLSQTSLGIDLPAIDSVAVHCSLFGLDGSLKPMIVFTIGDKSYHLFTGLGALTPDPLSDDGISYIDRIGQTIAKRINKPLEELGKDGGLADLFDKESLAKDNLENSMRQLEKEIDTLQLQFPADQQAINIRKRQIDLLLTKISARERRLAELARKIDTVQKKVDGSRSMVSEMETLLGPNPQKYTQLGNRFVFDDGVIFDLQSQDLIFPYLSKESRLDVRLIAASMVMGGQQMDEVQMFVNLTDIPKFAPPMAIGTPSFSSIDTTVAIYYWPDAFEVGSTDTSLGLVLSQINKHRHVRIVPQIEVAEIPLLTMPRYRSIEREKQAPLTTLSQKRKTLLTLTMEVDTLCVSILSATDGVPTRLSMLSETERKMLSVNGTNWQNNYLLAVLRAWWLARYLQKHTTGSVSIEWPMNEDRDAWRKIIELFSETQK